LRALSSTSTSTSSLRTSTSSVSTQKNRSNNDTDNNLNDHENFNDDNNNNSNSNSYNSNSTKKPKDKFIPYKNSKITHFLKDSLGGNSHTVFIVHLKNDFSCYQQNKTALTYAIWAKNIKQRISKISFHTNKSFDFVEKDPEVERKNFFF
jgi:hypothetical protein